jgi:hypothetical protein
MIDRVIIDTEIQHGKPIIKGTRVTITKIWEDWQERKKLDRGYGQRILIRRSATKRAEWICVFFMDRYGEMSTSHLNANDYGFLMIGKYVQIPMNMSAKTA